MCDFTIKSINRFLKNQNLVIGAIVGDVVGSFKEGNILRNPIKTTDFEAFSEVSNLTDDSYLTIATMKSLLRNEPFADNYRTFGIKYPAGYGPMFSKWVWYGVSSDSYGNGSAMRVSPIGWFFDTEEEVLEKAKESALCTHGHPEGIKGAQAVALCVFMARKGFVKPQIIKAITEKFGYDLNIDLDKLRPDYGFDCTCQGSVPVAIKCFLDSESVETAIRLAVSMGGDTDTMGAIAGSIAEAFYWYRYTLPRWFVEPVLRKIPLELLEIIKEFSTKVRDYGKID